ncbi:hypothetical protein [Vibrio intestinalis]|uniref:hypothetical protein n=1 Tax=Vibrio intestinalis TaxID=2933291 RepID=UPI0021A495B6|nr:hypothetical protein [Vibrio intestinalis]
MLKFINKQGVVSADGWGFQRINRFHYHYIEGLYTAELLVENNRVSIRRQLSWLPPNQGEKISIEKFEEILSRVQFALRFMNLKYELTIY